MGTRKALEWGVQSDLARANDDCQPARASAGTVGADCARSRGDSRTARKNRERQGQAPHRRDDQRAARGVARLWTASCGDGVGAHASRREHGAGRTNRAVPPPIFHGARRKERARLHSRSGGQGVRSVQEHFFDTRRHARVLRRAAALRVRLFG